MLLICTIRIDSVRIATVRALFIIIIERRNNMIQKKNIVTLVAAILALSSTSVMAAFVSTVIDHSPVSQPEINTIEELLGPPDGEVTAFEEVDSVTPGFVTVGFGGQFLNGPGNDISIYLTDWTSSDNEIFEVFASSSGDAGTFVSLGTSGVPIGGVNMPITVGFDLGAAGLSSALFLRIENSQVHPLIGEGPDIDAIEATNVVPIPPAIWLFGSGLIGLIGLARRKSHI